MTDIANTTNNTTDMNVSSITPEIIEKARGDAKLIVASIDYCLALDQYELLESIHKVMDIEAVSAVTSRNSYFIDLGYVLTRAIGNRSEKSLRYYFNNMRFMFESPNVNPNYVIEAVCGGIEMICQFKDTADFIEYLLSVICGPEFSEHYRSHSEVCYENIKGTIVHISSCDEITYDQFERIINLAKENDIIDSSYTIESILNYGIDNGYIPSKIAINDNLRNCVSNNEHINESMMLAFHNKHYMNILNNNVLCNMIRENHSALTVWVTILTVTDNVETIKNRLFQGHDVDGRLMYTSLSTKLDYLELLQPIDMQTMRILISISTMFENTQDLVQWIKIKLNDSVNDTGFIHRFKQFIGWSNNTMDVFELVCSATLTAYINPTQTLSIDPLIEIIDSIESVELSKIEKCMEYYELQNIIINMPIEQNYPLFKHICDKTNIGDSVYETTMNQVIPNNKRLDDIKAVFGV